MENNLTILIGLPCSGKTFYTKTISDPMTVVLSSDTIRTELFGYESQDDNNKVFQTMEIRCREALKSGMNVVYDATNLNRKRRKHLIRLMRNHCKEIRCICFICEFDEILNRNKVREDRYIPKEILIRMVKSFQPPMYDEGYSEITFRNTTRNIKDNKLVDLFPVDFEDFWHQFRDAISLIPGELYNYHQDNPHHNETLGNHIKTVMYECCDNSYKFNYYDRNILLISALYHDMGKPLSRTWDDKFNHARYIGHNNVSSYIFLCDMLNSYHKYYNKSSCPIGASWLLSLNSDDDYITEERVHTTLAMIFDILTLIELHDFIFSYKNIEHAKSKLEPKIGERLWSLLEILNESDRERI